MPMRQCITSVLLVSLATMVSACDRLDDGADARGAARKAGGEPLVQAKADDARLAQAAEEARRRWPEFVAAFNKREPNTAYAVKLAFPVKGKDTNEHMWIKVTAVEGPTISGVLNNDPIGDVGLKLGDPVRTTVDQIEDWLVGRGRDDLTGGFSIKVLEQIERERGGKP